MSLTIIETGEVVEPMNRVEAERITSRIADKLDAIADNLDQVLPLIGEALTRDAWKALGYASPTAYVSERFAGALARLTPEVRRPIVAQLSAAGMSTRAIAPMVGKDYSTVSRDRQVLQRATPESAPSASSPLPDDSGRVYKLTGPNSVANPGPSTVTGLDGKQYARPEPKPEPQKPKRRPLTDAAHDAGWEARKVTERIQRLIEDDRYARHKEEVATLLRSHLQFAVETYTEILDQLDS